MKLNVDLPDDMKEYLENQYKEYLKKADYDQEGAACSP